MGRTSWPDENSRILLNILNEEKNRGVSKFHWGNIAKKFNAQKECNVTGKQVQNHYSDLKERYKGWEELQGLSGISFNPITKKIVRNGKYGLKIIRGELANIDEMSKLFDGKFAHGVGGCFSPTLAKGPSYLSRQIEDLTNDDTSQDNEVSGDDEFKETMFDDEHKAPPTLVDQKVFVGTSRKRKAEEPISPEERKRRETSFDRVIALLSGTGVGSSSKQPSTAEMVSDELTKMKVAEESGDAYFVSADAIGAIDGTHIEAVISDRTGTPFRNPNGRKTWNVLGCCSFDKIFTFINVGWEGSAHDLTVWRDSLTASKYVFPHPPKGKYYLVDSGYLNTIGYLPPICDPNVRFHLPEFKHGPPIGMLEHFNYRHSSLRMKVECAFGQLKKRWKVLKTMPQMLPKYQMSIIVSCFTLHNFIRMHKLGIPIVQHDAVIGRTDTNLDDKD
ncbi:uncharacterized protein LOC141588554 [Silene latifolia]|uniref:uncharacterized protein LOC141588554 n=1 Tax=Silene latifolia TaxID=37657 RepID=UPI003D77227C